MWILRLIVIFYYCCFSSESKVVTNTSYIFGIRPKNCQAEGTVNGIPILYAEETAHLYVFGVDLTSDLQIGFTDELECDYPVHADMELQDNFRATVTFTPPSTSMIWSNTKWYACLKTKHGDWRHQGTGKNVALYITEPLLQIWMYVPIIIVCYILSSLLTGLNLGLMSLEISELYLLKKAGTPKEKKYATKIIPVRQNGNFLVCSIVITSTMCNAISTVATEQFFSGLLTVLITTALIVLFCEILPQSICSAYPLTIGARTIYLTKACMILTFPVSYPLSKFLNRIVGIELNKSYNKEKLKELLKKTTLPTHEEKIISGTLDFSNKKVEEVMTTLDDIFKLPITAVMNFETIAAILASGYSRIPIYVGDKSNIHYVLMTKDLALLDPDDNIPVKSLVQNIKSTCQYIPKGTTLDQVLDKFKESRHHMLFVTSNEKVSDKKESKPRKQSMDLDLEKKKMNVIGLVTFEDLIEEIFQMEILDETDTVFDNKGKKRISNIHKTDLLSLLLQPTKANTPSENVKLSAYCFLSEVDEFSIKSLSPKILIGLLNLDIYYTTSGNKLAQDTIYVRGVPADYFVMILEGQMEVRIGVEELLFEAKAFRHFGVEALKRGAPFTPDYTLQGVKKTLYLKISTTLYNAALLATKYERFKELPKINLNSEVYKYFTQILGPDSPK